MPISQHAPRTITAVVSTRLSAPLVEFETISEIAPVSIGISPPLHDGSMNDREKLWDTIHQQKSLPNVLRRSVESAPNSGRSDR